MTCSVCSPLAKQQRLSGGGSPGRRASGNGVVGTWDFKWAPGTTIRVAFQKPSDPEVDFSAVRQRVVDLAGRWQARLVDVLGLNGASDFAEAGVMLSFPDDMVFEPALGSDVGIAGSEQKSPFVPLEVEDRDYDVLVSLDPLPLTLIDPFNTLDAKETILLPYAELGNYSRRADYGMPTVFLGSPFEDMDIERFLATRAGAHAVVHEFGHVLGLAHSHQNPNYSSHGFRPASDIKAILIRAFGLESTDQALSDFVEEHFLQPWDGNTEFSDWPKPEPFDRLRSVMAHPAHAMLLPGTDPAKKIGDDLRKLLLEDDPNDPEDTAILSWPTRSDVDQLIYMYSPSPGRS